MQYFSEIQLRPASLITSTSSNSCRELRHAGFAASVNLQKKQPKGKIETQGSETVDVSRIVLLHVEPSTS
jgi:hypothetical protein